HCDWVLTPTDRARHSGCASRPGVGEGYTRRLEATAFADAAPLHLPPCMCQQLKGDSTSCVHAAEIFIWQSRSHWQPSSLTVRQAVCLRRSVLARRLMCSYRTASTLKRPLALRATASCRTTSTPRPQLAVRQMPV